MVEEYINKYQQISKAQDINNGFCFDFAMRLRERLGISNCLIVDTVGDDHCHTFVYTNGKYYDAETPYGEIVYNELPHFVRVEEDYGERPQICYATDPLFPPANSWRVIWKSNGKCYDRGWVTAQSLSTPSDA